MVPILSPNYLKTLGSRVISFYDKLMMNLHYGCLGVRRSFLFFAVSLSCRFNQISLDRCNGSSTAVCQNGGFPHPRDCSKCICPSGYGGQLCDERPSGCGEVLTATTSFQFFEHVGQKNASIESNGYAMCNYWIEAPAGSKIEVVLDYFSRGFSNDGCVHAAVEIKTENDKRLTGYRFCGRESMEHH
ncbi:Astacin (Peptidase M12A) [Parelaphostrongylus tenuis]|uniref:Astacin (Peptidase M12A) n=1 Tax=Parelaphostrongylus tenuis TaxID=148309 RepID=A0AAD5RA43_PARTN|nr:Astacin (Peptidase M12A) [Parelaphostrongylus tenuis]